MTKELYTWNQGPNVVNIYRCAGQWCYALFVADEYDSSDVLDVARGADEDYVCGYVRDMVTSQATVRRVPDVDADGRVMTSASAYADPVLVERMPDHLRDSHRAAGGWGIYPHNGAERVIVERADTESWCYDAESRSHSDIEDDEYDHIVRDAVPADFERYDAE